jgi:hypothetical protein
MNINNIKPLVRYRISIAGADVEKYNNFANENNFKLIEECSVNGCKIYYKWLDSETALLLKLLLSNKSSVEKYSDYFSENKSEIMNFKYKS